MSVELITVKTLWGWRKSEDVPELMEAWDYYSVDGYREGWEEACRKAIDSWGDDLYAHRYIDLDVRLDQVMGAFDPPTLGAEARESDD